MKKGFGIFCITTGAILIIIGVIGIITIYADRPGLKLITGLIILGLGLWLLNSSKKEDGNCSEKEE